MKRTQREETGGPIEENVETSKAPTFFVAGFWKRLAGAFIDLGLVLPTSLLLCWIASLLTSLSLPDNSLNGAQYWLALLVDGDATLLCGIALFVAIGCLYVVFCHVSLGSTLGMRVMGLRVVDAYGDEPSIRQISARTIGYVLCLGSAALGFFWIAFDREKRGLHDWIAGTYVVKA